MCFKALEPSGLSLYDAAAGQCSGMVYRGVYTGMVYPAWCTRHPIHHVLAAYPPYQHMQVKYRIWP